MAFRKCGMGVRRRWNGIPQMRNGPPEALEWHSANAERVSDGVGMPFRRSGTGVRRRWSAIPEVRNGCPEALECHSGPPERNSNTLK